MPPRRFSRHTFTTGYLDGSSREFLSDRTRFLFRDLDDNVQHVGRDADSWQFLAARFYIDLSQSISAAFSPAELWWVIADYQRPPVFDPTILPVPGVTIFAPSLRTVETQIFNPSVRQALGL